MQHTALQPFTSPDWARPMKTAIQNTWGSRAGSGIMVVPWSSHHSITDQQKKTGSQKIIKISRPSQTIWLDLIILPASVQVTKWHCHLPQGAQKVNAELKLVET